MKPIIALFPNAQRRRAFHKQQGVSLVAAIFIIVVLSTMVVFLNRLTAVQSAGVVQTMVSIQADYASRAGMQWGVAKALKGECSSANGQTIVVDLYSVAISCGVFSNGVGGVRENGTFLVEGVEYTVYSVASIATTTGRQPGDSDYVRRRYATQIAQVSP